MKGMIFTEFIDMVEDRFGLELADAMIEASGSPTRGAYTSVGTYDHHEMVRMVEALAQATGIPVPALIEAYGEHLFGYFLVNYPEMFRGLGSTFEFMENLDGYIHLEVRKLYADAELPRFEVAFQGSTDSLDLTYRSARAFADLARGLMKGCAAYFGENIEILSKDMSDGHGTTVRFTLQRV